MKIKLVIANKQTMKQNLERVTKKIAKIMKKDRISAFHWFNNNNYKCTNQNSNNMHKKIYKKMN